MRPRPIFKFTITQTWRVFVALCVTLPAVVALAEGGGGGAIDGNGGSGAEPTSLALLGVATGVGLLIARRQGSRAPGQGEEG